MRRTKREPNRKKSMERFISVCLTVRVQVCACTWQKCTSPNANGIVLCIFMAFDVLSLVLLPLHRVQECEINYVKDSSAPTIRYDSSDCICSNTATFIFLSERSDLTLKLLSTSVKFRGTIGYCHFTMVAYGWLASTNSPYDRNTCAEVTAFTPTTTHPPLQSRTKSFTNTRAHTHSGRSACICLSRLCLVSTTFARVRVLVRAISNAFVCGRNWRTDAVVSFIVLRFIPSRIVLPLALLLHTLCVHVFVLLLLRSVM